MVKKLHKFNQDREKDREYLNRVVPSCQLDPVFYC